MVTTRAQMTVDGRASPEHKRRPMMKFEHPIPLDSGKFKPAGNLCQESLSQQWPGVLIPRLLVCLLSLVFVAHGASILTSVAPAPFPVSTSVGFR